MSNETNPMDELRDELLKPFLQRTKQRAGIMAIIYNIIHPESPVSDLTEARLLIAKQFADFIDEGVMVGDDIDLEVMKAVRLFLETEKAVMDATDLVG